jgi:hypothetical protein
MNGIQTTATAANVRIEDPAAEPLAVLDDGLPPPTHAQVEYWRTPCGVLWLAKGAGMTDEAWPADLQPTKPTLKALVERQIGVRRGHSWHLKRGWYGRIAALRQRVVPTPQESCAEPPRSDLPSYAEIEGFERIGRWLDARPGRRARLPFVG